MRCCALVLGDIQSLISMELKPLEACGYFPVDEELSEIPIRFWRALQEDATSLNTSRSQELVTRSRTILSPVYRRLLGHVLRKICYPPADKLQSYSKEDLGRQTTRWTLAHLTKVNYLVRRLMKNTNHKDASLP